MPRRKLVAGNWKMNGLAASAAMLDELAAAHPAPGCDVLICPPATLIARLAGGPFAVGGQDCHWEPPGAHTGDISAEMLADAGAVAVIVGHSERRADHGETDALVARKAAAAWRAGLMADRLRRRDRGRARRRRDARRASARSSPARSPTARRRSASSIAYEPVWAIGTGRTPSLSEIAEVHGFMRERLVAPLRRRTPATAIRLLYGGSVKPGNAAEIFAVANVDGALVGGASLTAAGLRRDHRRRRLMQPGLSRPALPPRGDAVVRRQPLQRDLQHHLARARRPAEPLLGGLEPFQEAADPEDDVRQPRPQRLHRLGDPHPRVLRPLGRPAARR